ncbi:hypothetical protein [Helicobacter sp. 11S02629-2]|uniref:hypothetical protein n=1 Tax=Helicobacter sp. 11S02629-2 TaxID=1476195 RepID=UPI000BA714C6|nr:hypothetical protein [Helicobacter sp. 11S02629-2]PAF45915.1 hypothetical protein BKH40_00445 [Helicobacter sp. 11S02629-2]
MRSKFLYFLFVSVGAVIVLAGCATKANNITPSAATLLNNVPSWVKDIPDSLSAVDSAPIGNSLSNAMNIATNKARFQIAQNLISNIKGTFKVSSDADVSGNVEENANNRFENTVSVSLPDAVRTNYYIDSANKIVWVLVRLKNFDRDLFYSNLKKERQALSEQKIRQANMQISKQVSIEPASNYNPVATYNPAMPSTSQGATKGSGSLVLSPASSPVTIINPILANPAVKSDKDFNKDSENTNSSTSDSTN